MRLLPKSYTRHGFCLKETTSQLHEAIVDVCWQVTGNSRLCENNPALRRLLQMRGPHIDPVRLSSACSAPPSSFSGPYAHTVVS